MFTLLTMAVIALGILLVPILLLKLAFHLVVGLILLPFKLLGLVLGVVFGLVGVVFRVLSGVVGFVFSLGGALLAVAGVLAVLVVIPLLPFALIGLGLWLVFRQAGPTGRVLHVA